MFLFSNTGCHAQTGNGLAWIRMNLRKETGGRAQHARGAAGYGYCPRDCVGSVTKPMRSSPALAAADITWATVS